MNKFGRIEIDNFNRGEFEMYEKRFYDALERWLEDRDSRGDEE